MSPRVIGVLDYRIARVVNKGYDIALTVEYVVIMRTVIAYKERRAGAVIFKVNCVVTCLLSYELVSAVNIIGGRAVNAFLRSEPVRIVFVGIAFAVCLGRFRERSISPYA